MFWEYKHNCLQMKLTFLKLPLIYLDFFIGVAHSIKYTVIDL